MAAPSETTRIGWIGTGVMGASMCGHLLDAGYAVTVYTRTQRKRRPLLEHGRGVGRLARARWPRRPTSSSRSSASRPTSATCILGERRRARRARGRARVLVDMTTSEPSLAREIDAAAKAKGVGARRRAGLGRRRRRARRALSIMVGGDADVVERVQPLFEAMGKTIVHQGGPGAGQHTKMVNQILIATG